MMRVLPTLVLAAAASCPAMATAAGATVPHYDHIFLIIEENHGYEQIIGNPAAPHLNPLAQEYGLATSYFSTTDPSEPNYVAMLGGNSFGIADDGPSVLYHVNHGHRR